MPDDTTDLICRYSDLLNRHGLDSPEAVAFLNEHDNDWRFVGLAKTARDLKQMYASRPAGKPGIRLTSEGCILREGEVLNARNRHRGLFERYFGDTWPVWWRQTVLALLLFGGIFLISLAIAMIYQTNHQ